MDLMCHMCNCGIKPLDVGGCECSDNYPHRGALLDFLHRSPRKGLGPQIPWRAVSWVTVAEEGWQGEEGGP